MTPVCIFTFNRYDETFRSLQTLQENFLAKDSELYIFSDGPRNENDRTKIECIRKDLDQLDGFKAVYRIYSDVNKGLANSIVGGVSQVLEKHNSVIVLEDDLLTSKNFLCFLNQALDYYEKQRKVMSISGYTFPLPGLSKTTADFYFGKRASSWGWGTWRDRWFEVDWSVKAYDRFISSKKLRNEFNQGGSDMTRMLRNQMEGKIDSWAIRFCFQQFLEQRACVYPSKSKIKSIGFSGDATHTTVANRFITDLDDSDKRHFVFQDFEAYNPRLVKEFKSRFSLRRRGMDKILSLIN